MIWYRKKTGKDSENKKSPDKRIDPKSREGMQPNIKKPAATAGKNAPQKGSAGRPDNVQRPQNNVNPQINRAPRTGSNSPQQSNASIKNKPNPIVAPQKQQLQQKNEEKINKVPHQKLNPQPPKKDNIKNTKPNIKNNKAEIERKKPQPSPPPKRKPLTPEQEAEIKRRIEEKRKLDEQNRIIAERERQRRREITKAKLKTLLARAIMSLIMYVFIMIVVTVYIFAIGTGEKKEKPYYLIVETETAEKVYRRGVLSNRVFFGKDDTLYICISDLSEYYGMSVIGNYKNQMRFILKNNTDSFVIVNRDSTEAMVNKEPIRLSEPAVFTGGKVYLPLDFFTSYTQGIDITYDKKSNKIKIQRTVDEKNSNEIEKAYLDFSFVLKGANQLDKITIPEN